VLYQVTVGQVHWGYRLLHRKQFRWLLINNKQWVLSIHDRKSIVFFILINLFGISDVFVLVTSNFNLESILGEKPDTVADI